MTLGLAGRADMSANPLSSFTLSARRQAPRSSELQDSGKAPGPQGMRPRGSHAARAARPLSQKMNIAITTNASPYQVIVSQMLVAQVRLERAGARQAARRLWTFQFDVERRNIAPTL